MNKKIYDGFLLGIYERAIKDGWNVTTLRKDIQFSVDSLIREFKLPPLTGNLRKILEYYIEHLERLTLNTGDTSYIKSLNILFRAVQDSNIEDVKAIIGSHPDMDQGVIRDYDINVLSTDLSELQYVMYTWAIYHTNSAVNNTVLIRNRYDAFSFVNGLGLCLGWNINAEHHSFFDNVLPEEWKKDSNYKGERIYVFRKPVGIKGEEGTPDLKTIKETVKQVIGENNFANTVSVSCNENERLFVLNINNFPYFKPNSKYFTADIEYKREDDDGTNGYLYDTVTVTVKPKFELLGTTEG